MTDVSANIETSDGPSHLTLIIDLSPKQWQQSASEGNEYSLSLETFLTQVLAFLNTHLAGRHENSVAVLGAFPGSRLVGIVQSDVSTTPRNANVYQPFNALDDLVMERVKKHLLLAAELPDSPLALVGAMSKGLCHLNKLLNSAISSKEDIAIDPRMLILSVSPDMSASYIPIMNSIFAAQKLKVKIDVCKIYGEDTVFLQQAAHLTGGAYVSLKRRDALLQYLVMCFLASSSIRRFLTLPSHDRVDLRAACFCHKDIVDIGYVCSVCLSSLPYLFLFQAL